MSTAVSFTGPLLVNCLPSVIYGISNPVRLTAKVAFITSPEMASSFAQTKADRGGELKPSLSTPGVTRLPAESGFKSNTRQIAVHQHRFAGKRYAEVRKESVIFKKNTHGTHFLFTLTTVPVRK